MDMSQSNLLMDAASNTEHLWTYFFDYVKAEPVRYAVGLRKQNIINTDQCNTVIAEKDPNLQTFKLLQLIEINDGGLDALRKLLPIPQDPITLQPSRSVNQDVLNTAQTYCWLCVAGIVVVVAVVASLFGTSWFWIGANTETFHVKLRRVTTEECDTYLNDILLQHSDYRQWAGRLHANLTFRVFDNDIKIDEFKSNNYSYLFGPEKRVVVVGSAGGGKSFYANQLAYDWASNASVELTSHFNQLFIVQLKDLRFKTLVDEISSQLGSLDKHLVKESLSNATILQKTLVVLDGYEEFDHVKFRYMKEIVRGNEMAKVKILVTTRNQLGAGFFTAEINYRQLTIAPLKVLEQKQLTNYWFRNHKENSHLLARKLHNAAANHILRNPLLLSLACILTRPDLTKELPVSEFSFNAAVSRTAELIENYFHVLYTATRSKIAWSHCQTYASFKTMRAAIGWHALRRLPSTSRPFSDELSFPETYKSLLTKCGIDNDAELFTIAVQSNLANCVEKTSNHAEDCKSGLVFRHTLFAEYMAAEFLAKTKSQETNLCQTTAYYQTSAVSYFLSTLSPQYTKHALNCTLLGNNITLPWLGKLEDETVHRYDQACYSDSMIITGHECCSEHYTHVATYVVCSEYVVQCVKNLTIRHIELEAYASTIFDNGLQYVDFDNVVFQEGFWSDAQQKYGQIKSLRLSNVHLTDMEANGVIASRETLSMIGVSFNTSFWNHCLAKNNAKIQNIELVDTPHFLEKGGVCLFDVATDRLKFERISFSDNFWHQMQKTFVRVTNLVLSSVVLFAPAAGVFNAISGDIEMHNVSFAPDIWNKLQLDRTFQGKHLIFRDLMLDAGAVNILRMPKRRVIYERVVFDTAFCTRAQDIGVKLRSMTLKSVVLPPSCCSIFPKYILEMWDVEFGNGFCDQMRESKRIPKLMMGNGDWPMECITKEKMVNTEFARLSKEYINSFSKKLSYLILYGFQLHEDDAILFNAVVDKVILIDVRDSNAFWNATRSAANTVQHLVLHSLELPKSAAPVFSIASDVLEFWNVKFSKGFWDNVQKLTQNSMAQNLAIVNSMLSVEASGIFRVVTGNVIFENVVLPSEYWSTVGGRVQTLALHTMDLTSTDVRIFNLVKHKLELKNVWLPGELLQLAKERRVPQIAHLKLELLVLPEESSTLIFDIVKDIIELSDVRLPKSIWRQARAERKNIPHLKLSDIMLSADAVSIFSVVGETVEFHDVEFHESFWSQLKNQTSSEKSNGNNEKPNNRPILYLKNLDLSLNRKTALKPLVLAIVTLR